MAALTKTRSFPAFVGFFALVAAIALIELLIRVGVINRLIVALPSQIAMSFERVIVEEGIPERFWLTLREAFWATVLLTVFGVGIGVLLHRIRTLRLATETWVAAMASAPTVLMYPLFPVIFKTVEGLAGTRRVLIDVGRSFKLTPWQLYWKILFPAALPSIFVGIKLGMIFALINIVGVEFLINFGGLGQLINELAERYDLAGTYAAICFVILVSVLFFMFTERVERWLRPVN